MLALAPAIGKPHLPYHYLAPQLGPSRTMYERTFEQGVSPSPTGDRSDRAMHPSQVA